MDMAFVKADLDKEKNELNKLVSEEESARKAYEEFQVRIAATACTDEEGRAYDPVRCGACCWTFTTGCEQN